MKNVIEKLSSPKVDKELLEQFAQEASSLYLSNGVPLEETIVKIAERKDLNTHQIQRVCEFANLQTFQSLYKTSQDKTFEFDVADSRKIIREKNSPRVRNVETSIGSSRGESMSKESSIDVFGILFPEIELSKTASEVKESRTIDGIPYREVKRAYEKAVLAKESSVDRVNMIKMANEDLEREIHNVIKQSLLNGDLTESEIMAAAIQRFPEQQEYVKDLVMKTFKKLQSKNVIPVDETIKVASVYDNLLINDGHPLIRSINTLIENNEDAKKLESDIEKTSKVITFIDKKLK